MDTFHKAIMWTGTEAMVSMFIVTRDNSAPVLNIRGDRKWERKREKTYQLEDPEQVIPGRYVYEYDFVFDTVPDDFAGFVEHCIQVALELGAEVAWCAFEGAFHFFYLLDPGFAEDVYALGHLEGVWLAFDSEKRRTEEWSTRFTTALASLIDSDTVDKIGGCQGS